MKDYTEELMAWVDNTSNDPDNIGKEAYEEYAYGEIYEGNTHNWRDDGVDDNELIYNFTTSKRDNIWYCITYNQQTFSSPTKAKAQAQAARYLDAQEHGADVTTLLPGYKPPPTFFEGEPPF